MERICCQRKRKTQREENGDGNADGAVTEAKEGVGVQNKVTRSNVLVVNLLRHFFEL